MEFMASMLIEAAVNYEEMFSSVYKAGEQADALYHQSNPGKTDTPWAIFIKNWVGPEITWAEANLKKNHRIVWWLRWYKLALIQLLLTSGQSASKPSSSVALFEALLAKEVARFNAGAAKTQIAPVSPNAIPSTQQMGQYSASFKHWFDSLQITEIQDTPLSFQQIGEVAGLFRKFEVEYNNRMKEEKSWLLPQPGQTAIIKFPDGWAWWNLGTNYDREEADAMGHCGTAEDGNDLLSLREPRTMPDGSVRWKPHCTFEITGDGHLLQMKGRANEKPAAKYHSYIVKLLENERVEHVTGGGYRPETNFSLKDLPDADREELFEKKPELMPLDMYVAKFGMDQTVADKLSEAIKPEYSDFQWNGDVERPKFVIETWGSRSQLVSARGNSTAKWVLERLEGGGFDDDYDGNYEAVWDDLPDAMQEKIGLILQHEYPEEAEEAGLDPGTPREVWHFAESVGADELLDALRRGAETGNRYGAEAAMSKALDSALDDSCYESIDPEDRYDGQWALVADLELACKIADRMNRGGFDEEDLPNEGQIKVEEPYYGFQGWDKDAAVEDFDEQYDVDGRFTEAFGEKALKAFNKRKVDKGAVRGRVGAPKASSLALTATFLVEAAVNYEEMFASLYKVAEQEIAAHPSDPDDSWNKNDIYERDLSYIKNTVKGYISWAEEFLKKNYRIIWFLRWAKLSLLESYANRINYYGAFDAYKVLLDKEIAKFNAKAPVKITTQNIPTTANLDRLVSNLRHYFSSSHLTKVQNYPLDYQNPAIVVEQFEAWETEYNERLGKFLKPSDIQPGDKPILKFPDGWAWWQLDRGYDAAEGRCMGHCGTGARDSKLLSLREPHVEDGITYWEPHLTFELTAAGQLRQTKGRANSKPKEEYHPYIVALLKLPIIKGNEGGGYKPETNFALADLKKEHEEEVFWANPSVLGWHPLEGEPPYHETVVEFPDGDMWRRDGTFMALLQFKENPTTGQKVYRSLADFMMNDTRDLSTMRIHDERVSAEARPHVISEIAQLLRQPCINGIDYPVNDANFSMEDIPEPERTELFDLKPGLMSSQQYYNKFGADRNFTQKVERYFTERGDRIGWWPDSNEFTVDHWSNLADLVQAHGDDRAKWIVNVMNGNDDLDIDSGQSQQEDAKTVLNDLPKDKIEKIGLILKYEHADVIADWLESEGRDPEDDEFDPTDDDDIVSFADYTNDEVLTLLSQAYSDGARSGTEKEMIKYLKSALENSNIYKQSKDSNFWDDSWYATLGPQAVLEMMDEDRYLWTWTEWASDNLIEVTEPYNGFNEYDDASAVERFNGEYNVDREFESSLGENGVQRYNDRKELEKRMEEERIRVMPLVRKSLVGMDVAKIRMIQQDERAFRNGHYAPYVQYCQSLDPEAFSFYHPDEETADAETAEDALA